MAEKTWLEKFELKEKGIRKQLETGRRKPDFATLELHNFAADIDEYRRTVAEHCSGMDAGTETAVRYALRLKFPLLHHLQSLLQTAVPKKTA